MPAKRRSVFCCLGGSDDTPEIIVDNSMILQTMKAEEPMPPLDDLNVKFEELVDELDLPAQHRERMFSLSPEKKWQIYCSKKRDQEDPNSTTWPDYYVDQINAMMTFVSMTGEDEIVNRTKLVDSLKTALRTQPMKFVIRFLELDGLSVLLKFLGKMDYETMESPIHTSIIGCIKALMNNSHGRANVLAHPTAINIISQSMITENIKTKIAVLEIMGGVCLVPGGHKKVLGAMCHYQEYASERTRFQRLINDLDRSTGKYRDDVHFKTACMSFVNAVIKYGAGEDNLEFRIHLRYEFLMLGIQPVIDKLRTLENATLDRHLDFFELVRNEDERELAKRFDMVHVDVRNANNMFDVIKKKISHTEAYTHLMSVLQHLLLLPNQGKSIHYWSLVDLLLQQIVLQFDDGGDPDVSPFDINFKDVIEKVINQDVIRQREAEERQKEYGALKDQLDMKDRELDGQEKQRRLDFESMSSEEAMAALNALQEKSERQAADLTESRRQSEALQQQLAQAQQMVASGKLNGPSISDDDKLQKNSVGKGTPPPPPPPMMGGAPAPQPPPFPGVGGPPPPPPPAPGMGGPPPPPGMPGPPPIGGMVIPAKKRDLPKPSNPLKSFNWAKLPDMKIQGTIWQDLDDLKVIKVLDLREFDDKFSAYQKKAAGDGGESEDIMGSIKSQKPKELSLIDGRRAQNCTILLSKLKLANPDIRKAMLAMDPGEALPKDMVEQLLKYVPTPEEISLLKEHEREADNMAKADRFFLEMSKIDHYEQRLKCLFFKKRFQERLGDVKPKVEAVLKASKEVGSSRKLKKILEIVLAFGNYMNRGARGNASGFKVSSLNKIIDTKSSSNRSMTLLHYLIEMLENKFPEVVKLEEEMPNVHIASKVNMQELEKEVAQIALGLREVETELEYQKKKSRTEKHDKFVSVMSDFKTISSISFGKLQDVLADAKQKFQKVATSFGEDPVKTTPEELFGTFDLFLQSFRDAKLDNENIRKKREEEEKRARMEKERLASRQQKSKDKSKGKGKGSGDGEFDDLISALRTGDMFSDDMTKLKKNKRRQVPGQQHNNSANSGADGRERLGKPKTGNGRSKP